MSDSSPKLSSIEGSTVKGPQKHATAAQRETDEQEHRHKEEILDNALRRQVVRVIGLFL